MSRQDCCDICEKISWEIGAVQLQTTREDKAAFEICVVCLRRLRQLVLAEKR